MKKKARSTSFNQGRLVCLSLGRYGGCVKYSYEIMKRFKHVDIFCTRHSTEIIDFECNKIPTFKGFYSGIVASAVLLPMYLVAFVFIVGFRKYNALYIPYYNCWNIFFIMMARLLGLKIVVTEHDGVIHTGDSNSGEQILRNWCLRNADYCIFLSEHVQKLVNSFIHIPPEKYSVIHHGIFEYCRKSPEELLSVRSKQNTGLSVLFLGRISKYKGVELLLEAVQSLAPTVVSKMIIAGKALYPIEPKYLCDSRIHLNDQFLSDEEMARLLELADVLVLPYTEASQSGVLTLGVDFCLPMIISKRGGLIEQLSSNEAIFVEPDAIEIAQALIKLHLDYAERVRLTSALAQLKLAMSWDVIADKLEKICGDIQQ